MFVEAVELTFQQPSNYSDSTVIPPAAQILTIVLWHWYKHSSKDSHTRNNFTRYLSYSHYENNPKDSINIIKLQYTLDSLIGMWTVVASLVRTAGHMLKKPPLTASFRLDCCAWLLMIRFKNLVEIWNAEEHLTWFLNLKPHFEAEAHPENTGDKMYRKKYYLEG